MDITRNVLVRMSVLLCIAMLSVSCLNEYLDRSPDAGISEEEVFTQYENFRSYFNSVYNGANFNIKCHYPLWFAGNNQKMTMEGMTDMCDMARVQRCQPIKQGIGSQAEWAVGYNTESQTAKVPYSWKCIRVANMTIANIDRLLDATDREKTDLLAQAYFIRAFCHFELFRFYGSLPYIDKVLGADDEWDLPRLSDLDYLDRVAADFQTAADLFRQAGLMRRDPVSGAGHLAATDQDKPNGVTALAMKGRALLYAASPLSNVNNDRSRWELAAAANAAALDAALTNGYELLTMDRYTDNFYGVSYSNEQLWAYTSGGTTYYANERMQAFIAYPFSQNAFNSAQCPTQNFVDRYETADGYPLNTEEQRLVAANAGSYNEQDPYSNRDPRMDVTIIYNQKPVQGYGNASLYVNEDGTLPSGSMLQKREGSNDGVSETYYYEHKRHGALSRNGVQNLRLTDPIIRLAEVYLNYAEAANEAYGPDGSAPGAAMTALQALNTVRQRANMPPVHSEYTTGTDALRPRIKNERTVELCFEGFHYYCDIRRWKDAPELYRSTLYGMRAMKLTGNYDKAQYPTGFRYDRFALPATRQIAWKNDGMYYMPFQQSDLIKMTKYIPNMSW